MAQSIGIANVWFCDPEYVHERVRIRGCGFFGFYKPETDKDKRTCPACGQQVAYSRTPDQAHITVVTP